MVSSQNKKHKKILDLIKGSLFILIDYEDLNGVSMRILEECDVLDSIQ